MPKASAISFKARLAWMLLLLAVGAWYLPQTPDLLRVAPAGFACWHEGLQSQPGLYADHPELLGFANRSVQEFADYLSARRSLAVSGPVWEALDADVQASFGRDRADLPRTLRWRAADDEPDYVNALYYRVDEPPFDTLSRLPEAGDFLYLEIAGQPKPLQLLRVPEGAVEGVNPGCRWYYRDWQIPDAFHYPARFLALWFVLALGLLLFGRALYQRLRLLLTGGRVEAQSARGNPRLRQARIALTVTLACLGGVLYSVFAEPDWYTAVSGILGFFSFTTLIVLWRSGLRLQRILDGEENLLRWDYAPAEWAALLDHLCGGMAEKSRGALALVGGMLALAAVIVLIAAPNEAGVITALVLGVILLMVTFAALVMPGARRHWLKRAPQRVIVAMGGVLIGNEFHDFRMSNTRFHGARIEKAAGRTHLVLGYSYSSRHGQQGVMLELPPPEGGADDLSTVVAALNQQSAGD